jgi:hypothetical protein
VLRVACVAGVLVVTAGSARADESALSASLAWATYTLPDDNDMDITPTVGGALAVEYERAFAEPLSWRIELAGGVFHGDGTSWRALADRGIVYRFDVLKYVPYAFVGVGAVAAGGGPLADTIDPVLVFGGGLDILRGRERSWGFEGRLASFAGDVTTLSLGARYTFRWGFF